MTDKTSLGDRMKQFEAVTQSHLMRRMPVIIRLDGRAFHTFTKRLPKIDPSLNVSPFSTVMHEAMTRTTASLFVNVQNCVLAYTQSDEISLLLTDWNNFETQQWFDGNVQKIVSSSASIATAAFNFAFFMTEDAPDKATWMGDLAHFDSRVYNLPKEEVTNYFIWRQQDCSRNSVQMLGRFHFSQKEMHGKNNSEVQDMLMLEKGVNWNDIPTWMRRGTCITNKGISPFSSAMQYVIDDNIPIFTRDRFYIEECMLTHEQLEVID